MKKESIGMLKAGMEVTFNWGKDSAGNPILRKGIFRKMSKEHPNQAVVVWKKDDEDEPKRHWVHFGALHTAEIDELERQATVIANEEKALKKANAAAKKAEKEKSKSSKKVTKQVALHNKNTCSQVDALRKLADAVELCKSVGINPSELGIM